MKPLALRITLATFTLGAGVALYLILTGGGR